MPKQAELKTKLRCMEQQLRDMIEKKAGYASLDLLNEVAHQKFLHQLDNLTQELIELKSMQVAELTQEINKLNPKISN